MPKPKRESVFTLRMHTDTLVEYHIACELRGATMSGLVHQFMVQMIREEKERDPARFTPKAKATVMKEMEARAKLKRRK